MSLGQSMMNWLRSVDKDQNLQGIADLTSTSMSDRVRRWFRRQDLTPTLDTGYYEPRTERYALGPTDGRHIITDTVVGTTQTTTLTCAAGHAYRVIYAWLQNVTRNYDYTLTYTPSGGSAGEILERDTAIVTTDKTAIMGAASSASLGVNGGVLWMQAGDTLVIVNNNFVGGDTVSAGFIYEDYTL